MKSRHPVLTALCAGLLAALAATAFAATGTTTTNHEASKLATTYTTFAGSETNSEALVKGLSGGTSITLEAVTPATSSGGASSTTTTTFQPATGKLGYGEVNITLALAKDELAALGITAPTSAEIEAALNGGTITLADGSTQTMQGVLALRAQGEGWGQIANTLGFKLGDVVSASKTDHSQAGADHGRSGNAVAAANRPERPVHPDHPQRPDVPQRPDIPDHAGRPGGH